MLLMNGQVGMDPSTRNSPKHLKSLNLNKPTLFEDVLEEVNDEE